nr:DUF2480 family protein [Nafulsella turpanensis]
MIENRVAKSGLITIDLEDFYVEGERVELDIAPVLFQGMVLREKDFRQWVKEHQWEQYQGKLVAIFCSADAIVPTWAYMLIATKIVSYAKMFVCGSAEKLEEALFQQAIEQVKSEEYRDAKLVIKGCSHKPVPTYAYVELSRKLAPVAASIMYGEPCSTVPVYKRPKQ